MDSIYVLLTGLNLKIKPTHEWLISNNDNTFAFIKQRRIKIITAFLQDQFSFCCLFVLVWFKPISVYCLSSKEKKDLVLSTWKIAVPTRKYQRVLEHILVLLFIGLKDYVKWKQIVRHKQTFY